MFPAGKKEGDAMEYDGGRTSSDIVNWATEKLAANLPPPEVVQVCPNQVEQAFRLPVIVQVLVVSKDLMIT